jgi:hypothetical protein
MDQDQRTRRSSTRNPSPLDTDRRGCAEAIGTLDHGRALGFLVTPLSHLVPRGSGVVFSFSRHEQCRLSRAACHGPQRHRGWAGGRRSGCGRALGSVATGGRSRSE